MTLAFTPRPIRPQGPLHRRAAVVAALSVAFLLMAVLKPWPDEQSSTAPPTRPPRATPTATAGRVAGPASVDLDAAELARLTPQRDGWGVRLISITESGDLSEVWVPAIASSGVGWPSYRPAEAALAPILAEHLVALGITSPFDETPLTMRAWQLGDGYARLVSLQDAAVEAAEGDRITTAAAGAAPLGQRVFLPPVGADLHGPTTAMSVDGIAVARSGHLDGSRPARWPGGIYRFDVLVGAAIRTLTVELPTAVDPTTRGLTWVDTSAEVRNQVQDVVQAADFPVPQLAWVDGEGILRLVAATTADAIRDPEAPPSGARGSPRMVDAVAYVEAGGGGSWIARDDVAALGVVLPRGSAIRDVGVTQISPYRSVLATELAEADSGDGFSGDASNAALAWSSTGFALSGGIYRIDARWSVDGTDRQGSWLAALSGGTNDDIAPDAWWQAAMRAYPYAGTWGVVATGEPSAASRRLRGARAVPVMATENRRSDMPSAPAALVAACNAEDDELLSDGQSLLGITAPPAAGIGRIAVERLLRTGATIAVPIAAAPTTTPGVVLMALQAGGTWRPGVYRVYVRTVDGTRAFTFGIGSDEPLSGAILPPCNTGRA